MVRRPGTPPARHYDLAARSSLHGSGGNAGDGSAAPGRKPPRWSAERRASRVMGRAAPRWARMVAPRTRDNENTAPVGAPPAPLRGRVRRDQRPTRAPTRAAATKKTALFDIVRFERCVGEHRTLGLCESRATVLSCPGRASVSERRAGTQGLHGKIDGQLKRPVVPPLGPRKSGLPDLRRLTADLGQPRDRCLASLARDTRAAQRGTVSARTLAASSLRSSAQIAAISGSTS
jgi:hypothetical protein